MKIPPLKLPPLSANSVMIAIGGLIVILMVASAGVKSYRYTGFAKKCKDGDIKVCTYLLESKKLPDKEAGAYYAFRGNAYDQKGEQDKAIADYSSAIDLTTAQTQALIYASRASIYVKKARYSEAIADYSSAIRLAPAAVGFYCSRADAEYHKGDSAGGDADLEQVRKAAPKAACLAKLEDARKAAAAAPATSSP